MASIQNRVGKWSTSYRVVWRDGDGKQCTSRSLSTLAEAEAEKSLVESRLPKPRSRHQQRADRMTAEELQTNASSEPKALQPADLFQLNLQLVVTDARMVGTEVIIDFLDGSTLSISKYHFVQSPRLKPTCRHGWDVTAVTEEEARGIATRCRRGEMPAKHRQHHYARTVLGRGVP